MGETEKLRWLQYSVEEYIGKPLNPVLEGRELLKGSAISTEAWR